MYVRNFWGCLYASDVFSKLVGVCLSKYILLNGKQILMGLLVTTEPLGFLNMKS